MGWTFEIWNGLVIDLVMVNHIFCTPLVWMEGFGGERFAYYCFLNQGGYKILLPPYHNE